LAKSRRQRVLRGLGHQPMTGEELIAQALAFPGAVDD
jgi:hypothetical protein